MNKPNIKLHDIDFYMKYVENNSFENEKSNDVIVEKINESNLLIKSFKTSKIHKQLDRMLSVRTENYMFNPKYRKGHWDGYIHFYKSNKQQLPVGLLIYLIHFAYINKYSIMIKYNYKPKQISEEKVLSFIQKLKLADKITTREYQIKALRDCLEKRRIVTQITTSGGKSFIIYCLARYCVFTQKKLLIVVPRISLVYQLEKDFIDYGWHEAESFIQKRCSKENKELKKPIIISSWQSIYKNKKELQLFKAVIIDESHESKAKSLCTLMNDAFNAELRIGFTGTMPLEENFTDWLTVVSNIGLPTLYANYKTLREGDFVAKIKVILTILDYELEQKQQIYTKTGKDYQSEMAEIIVIKERNNLICNIATKAKGNTLILFFRTKHGKQIYSDISEKVKATEYKVFYVDGSTSIIDRERVREITERKENVIIVASMQIFSTGINITNLNNLVFAHFTKSYYKVLQSIGRVMRKHPDKEFATVYDIIDNLCFQDEFGNKIINYAIKHAKVRKTYYITEGYEVEKKVIQIIQLKGEENETKRQEILCF